MPSSDQINRERRNKKAKEGKIGLNEEKES
jgi:hypothetical protein